MPGPQKTPRHLKLLRNSLQRCHDLPSTWPSLPALDSVPAPPAYLVNVAARAEWDRIAPVLFTNRMLTVGRTRALADWCALGAKISDAWLANTTPSAALMSVHRRLANDLGLNAINLATPAAKTNRFSPNALRRR